MDIQLRMEDSVARGVSCMDVLHQGRKIAVQRVEAGQEEFLDRGYLQPTLLDHLREVESDLAVLHVHLELPEEHGVVGPGEQFGDRRPELAIADPKGIVRRDLEKLALVGDAEDEAVVRVPSAH